MKLSHITDFFYGLISSACPLAPGLYPFGVSLLCGLKSPSPFFALGVLLCGGFSGSAKIYSVFSAVYTFAIRLLFKKTNHTPTRALLLSLAFSALTSVTMLFRNGIGLYSLIQTACCVLIICCVSMLTFYSDKNRFTEHVFFLLKGCFLVGGAVTLSPFGLPAGFALALLLTAYCGHKYGYPFSGASGVVWGLCAGLNYAPIAGIFGLIHGLFLLDTPIFAPILAYFVSSAAALYVLPLEKGAACAFTLIIPVVFSLVLYRTKGGKSPKSLASLSGEMASLAAGFSSLSGLFYTVSEKELIPSRDKLYPMVKEKLSDICMDCSRCGTDLGDISAALTAAASEGREFTQELLPPRVIQKCPCKGELLQIPSECLTVLSGETATAFKEMGRQYGKFSALLGAQAKQAEEKEFINTECEKRLCKVLEEKGIYFDKVRVSGVREIKAEVFGVHPDSIRLSPKELSKGVGSAVGRCVSPPEFAVCGQRITAVFRTVPAIKAEAAKMISPRKGETVCGDTVTMFENGKGYFYALVADGMGSGREANMVSRLSGLYLEKLMTVGGDLTSSLNLLNDSLSSSEGETFTTVDILEADRYLARVRILKAGAAPSFLIRGGKQYIIKSQSPPLGIIKEVTPKQTSFSVKRGDIVLLCSDGVDISPDAISKAFSADKPISEGVAQLIAIGRKKGLEDDMSVCAVRFY